MSNYNNGMLGLPYSTTIITALESMHMLGSRAFAPCLWSIEILTGEGKILSARRARSSRIRTSGHSRHSHGHGHGQEGHSHSHGHTSEIPSMFASLANRAHSLVARITHLSQ